jgi:glutamyl/glutaminyl-tRNA synthetase
MLSNTPRQILIQRAIGAPTPSYAHLPLVLGTDKQKLSKRRGALALTEYRDRGYLPDAIINMVTLVGWNPGTDQELFSKDELVHAFDLKKVQKSPAVFNVEKLDWINKEYIKRLTDADRLSSVKQFIPENIKALSGYSLERLAQIVPLITERLSHFDEVRTMAESGELSYYFAAPTYDKEKLFWKEDHDSVKLVGRLTVAADLLRGVSTEQFTKENIKDALWEYAEKEGRGQVLWPLRFALSGREKSPDPIQLAAILGKTETISRIEYAIAMHHAN